VYGEGRTGFGDARVIPVGKHRDYAARRPSQERTHVGDGKTESQTPYLLVIRSLTHEQDTPSGGGSEEKGNKRESERTLRGENSLGEVWQ